MLMEKHSAESIESAQKDSPAPQPITLLHAHKETDRYGDTTASKLWGVVRGGIGVVVETQVVTTDTVRSLSAHALSLYLADSDTTLHFVPGTRDAQGEAVTKISNPGVVAGIHNKTVDGDVSDTEKEAVGTVAHAYASLAGLEPSILSPELDTAA